MATYASVAAQNAPPPSEQPRPDPSLLNTESGNPGPVQVDEKAKVTVVPRDFKEYLSAENADAEVPELISDPSGGRGGGESGRRRSRETVAEGTYVWRQLKRILFRPEVAGGLVGLINTAVIGTVAYYGYHNWDRPRWDRRVVTSVSVGLIALWGAEGYIAEKYRERSRH